MVARQTPANKTADKKTDGKKREAKVYAPVDMSLLKARDVTKEEKVTVLPGRERTKEQKVVDGDVRDAAFKMIAAGMPKDFRDMPVKAYTIPPAVTETVKFMVNKACHHLNCLPKWGRPAWDGGNEVITFAAIPRDPSQWTDKPMTEDGTATGSLRDQVPDGLAKKDNVTVTNGKTDPNKFLDS